MAMLGNLGENLTKTMKKLVGISVIDKKTIDTNPQCLSLLYRR